MKNIVQILYKFQKQTHFMSLLKATFVLYVYIVCVWTKLVKIGPTPWLWLLSAMIIQQQQKSIVISIF